MTEVEAKGKWCPMSRLTITQMVTLTNKDRGGLQIGTQEVATPITVNRNSDSSLMWGTHCVASGCMMWRKNQVDSGDGYCGLAGFAVQGVGA